MAALPAHQHQHGVIFASRRHNTGHRRRESLAGHRTGIGRVRRAQIADQQRIQPGLPVPFEAVQVVSDRMVCLVAGSCRHGVQNVVFCQLPEERLQIDPQLGGVIIVPCD